MSAEPGAERSGQRLVILDDDPTGTQTVSDIPVITRWDEDDIAWALQQQTPGFFILTNTRSLHPDEAAQRVHSIVTTCMRVAYRTGFQVHFASRGDSTLRGHFPLEIDVIADVLADAGRPVDVVLVAPGYFDAGRVTVNGTHYLESGGKRIPVSETEFARDATFGFASSFLPDWVEEKSSGRIAAEDVLSLALDDVRGDPAILARVIGAQRNRRVVVPDATRDEDLRAVAVAVEHAQAAGSEIVSRVGPSFVRAAMGQSVTDPVSDSDLAKLVNGNNHGLVVVGSHVAVTTRQLLGLAGSSTATIVELDVDAVVGIGAEAHVRRVAEEAIAALATDLVIVTTTRTVRRGLDASESLAVAASVSAAMVATVRQIVDAVRPRFIVAKGGITSSDIATEALGIRRAYVRGTMLPGIVSLWESVDGPAAGMAYVVFAGNVGDDAALTDVVDRLDHRSDLPGPA